MRASSTQDRKAFTLDENRFAPVFADNAALDEIERTVAMTATETAKPTQFPACITDEHRKQYKAEGYCILERAIPPEQLRMLQDQCQHFIDVINAEMDAKGVKVDGINHRDS